VPTTSFGTTQWYDFLSRQRMSLQSSRSDPDVPFFLSYHNQECFSKKKWAKRNHHHYIREEHYVAHFGPVHRFRIVRPVIVAGRPRFQYGGYWFVIGRPLPPGWHYTDEVYVDYIGDGIAWPALYILESAFPSIFCNACRSFSAWTLD
jgi:hypothetical protein